ncbi:hypothetical protein PMKS-002194 [Pichia membranifaciens]|uniref:Transcription factor domain-containing protein n=1 Tax=Pichia membranifaciens TaxID=4926 RepID=A0A1Q2YGM5_9ASCO|nr:hypothetical protein PMKS-002194 [Pichia membranifaciens]
MNPNPLLLNKTLSTSFHNRKPSSLTTRNSVNFSDTQNGKEGPNASTYDLENSSMKGEKLSSRPSDSNLPSITSSIQSLTNNATMIYLAHVAGKVAHADSRDHINGAERLSQLERSVPIPRSLSSSNTNNLDDSRGGSYFDQSSDSKNSPSHAGDTEPILDSFGHDNSLYPVLSEDRLTVPPLTTSQSMRQRPSGALADIEYIASTNDPKDAHSQFILTEMEAKRLIKIFFVTMHPFYPYIPKTLRDPDTLAGYPMLLCALLAISSRYNPLPDKMGAWDDISDDDTAKRKLERGEKDIHVNSSNGERHLAVHERLWIYCQRLMSMTVWGESSSRSVGTLLTFLMFTEWNPRAIHFRWGDYANSAQDDSLANKKFDKRKNKNVGINSNGKNKNKNKANGRSDSNPIDTDDDNENDEEFAGLSAMKRSEIMSFMLIGTATRLSFLLDTDPLIFIATHVSETHIAVGLNKKSMLQQTLSEVDVNDPAYQFSHYQKANLELLQFFSLCYETLYGTRPKFISLDKYQTLAILDILSPILENWYRKYYKLLKPSNIHCAPLAACNDDGSPDWLYLITLNPKLERDLTISIERESLILDYYYTKLYLYSLALSGDTSVNANLRNSKKGRNLRLDELARYSRYVELAYKGAKEVLAVIQRVRKLRLLKYMPVRWVTRVIKSVSFIVKCYLTLTTDIHTNTSFDSGVTCSDQKPLHHGITPFSSGKSDENMDFYGSGEKEENTNGEILKLSVIPLEEIITLLQKTAICLRYAAPDELHLCTRYSTILMYLCSQFKTQMRERNENKSSVREYEKDTELDVDPIEEESENANVNMNGNENENTNENGTENGDENSNENENNTNTQTQNGPVPELKKQTLYVPQASQQEFQQESVDNIHNSYMNNSDMQNNQMFNSSMYPGNNRRASIVSSSFGNTSHTGNTYQPMDYGLENINFSSANQQLFDDFFNKNPSEKLFNFFSTNDNNPGLDFVDQFTKEIEKDFLSKGGKH